MSTMAVMPDFSTLVNIKAVKNGNASDPTTWNLNRTLQAGDYFDTNGFTVVWDLTTCPNLGGFSLSGEAGGIDAGTASGNKVINLTTGFLDMGTSFTFGNNGTNTPGNGTLTVTFLNTPLNSAFDPGQFSNGLLAMGAMVDICGSQCACTTYNHFKMFNIHWNLHV